MHSFFYRKNELYCEQTSVKELAERHGTPLYVYSQETVARHFQDLDAALQPLDHQICYAVKANSNLAVLRLLARLGRGVAPRHRRGRRPGPVRLRGRGQDGR